MSHLTSARRHPRASASRATVLQVVLSLSPGGTERLVVEIVRRLKGKHCMKVVCLDSPGQWGEELIREGVDLVALGRSAGFRPALGRQIARVAERSRATVLHCHHYTPFVYGCVARLLRPNLRLIFTEHGRLADGPSSRKRWIANQVLSRMPSRVCAVSADLRQHMATEGFPAEQIAVVPNGIEPGVIADAAARRDARAMLGLADDAFVMGTVGRLDPVKDIPTLIAAFGQVRAARPGARLVIVGEGSERAHLEQAAGDVPGILFTGHRADVRRCLAAFDTYVSSSIFEGVSLTILEAMSTGLPVVATRVGGTPEVVVDRETGLLVEARDANGLAAALLRVLEDTTAATAMGLAGRARLCERFTLDRMVNQYAAAYAELGAY